MKKTLLITGLIISLFATPSLAQKRWTLEDCINYAVTNNIGVQRQKLLTESASVDYLTSTMNVLPTLNLGSDLQFQSGRSINPLTNIITFNQNLLNSFYVSSNLVIFNGFTRLNTIAANKFLVKAGLQNEMVQINSLVIDLMGQYYQVLYSQGLEDASKMQLELSEKQLFRIDKMVTTGKEAYSKKLEIESQVSTDRLSYTIAMNNTSQAKTTLKHMLQLGPGTDFDILPPNLDSLHLANYSFNTDSVYSIAEKTLPRLKAIEYELKASKKQVAAAIGASSPTLSIGGSVSTGYYNVLNLSDTIKQSSYPDQIHGNIGEAVYISLRIPLFNNFSSYRNVQLAKIKKRDNELRLEQERNNLFTDIENACLSFNRGRDEYAAAVSNLDFNRKSFESVEKKFITGLVSVTEYSAAKTTLFKAETEELRTKLQLVIRKLTIQFYATGNYNNLISNPLNN